MIVLRSIILLFLGFASVAITTAAPLLKRGYFTHEVVPVIKDIWFRLTGQIAEVLPIKGKEVLDLQGGASPDALAYIWNNRLHPALREETRNLINLLQEGAIQRVRFHGERARELDFDLLKTFAYRGGDRESRQVLEEELSPELRTRLGIVTNAEQETDMKKKIVDGLKVAGTGVAIAGEAGAGVGVGKELEEQREGDISDQPDSGELLNRK